jgi:hypothetical protein
MTRILRSRLVGLLMAVVVLSATACSAAPNLTNLRNTSAPAATSAPSRGQAASQPGAAAGAPASNDAAAPSQPAPGDKALERAETSASQAQPLERMVIRNAQLAIEVSDVEGTIGQVRQIAQQSGGFVSASNTRIETSNGQERHVAELTIQVPSEDVDATLSALRGLGKVSTETSGSQDVTEEYVDLDSNLRNLQASESAILRLMDRAERIEDVVSLQRELTQIRGQIERIQGRKRYLERRTDMATISLSLRLPPGEGSQPGGVWNPLTYAQRGWQASLTVLRVVAEVALVVLAFSWWLIPILALAGYIVLQRRRPRAAPPAAPADA